MKLHFSIFLFLFLSCIACTNEIEEIQNTEKLEVLQLNETVRQSLQLNVTAEDFDKKIQGFAWQFVDGFQIDEETGRIYSYSFYRGGYDEDGIYHGHSLAGYSSRHPYFEDDVVKIFSSNIALGGEIYSECQYEFNESNCGIYLERNGEIDKNEYPWLYIDKVESDLLYAVHIYTFDKNYYVYNVYRKMNSEELQEYLKTHKKRQ